MELFPEQRSSPVPRVPAAVAAHHQATAAAALEILEDGGSAADAAVAGGLAACVAETTMTSLGGGGHAVHWDAAAGSAQLLDCFVTVPGLEGGQPARPVEVVITFESEPVPYLVGPGSVGVPGVPAGLHALWLRYGRLPWSRLVEPALALARAGVPLPPSHARVLAMLAPALTLNEGARIFSPGGRLLGAGEAPVQPGLVTVLELLRDHGAAMFYKGPVADALLALMAERGGPLRRADLDAYEARWSPAPVVRRGGVDLLARRDLAGMVDTLARLPAQTGAGPAQRARALAGVLGGPDPSGHTTNVSVVDAEGNACAFTTSLGLGSGDFLADYDVHLNSMLGERDLQRGSLVPGARMGSMIVPTVVADADGLVAVAGAAGGARIRSAMVQTLSGLLDDGLPPTAAVERPRLHVVAEGGRGVVHAEPGADEDGLAALESDGWDVRRWRTRHHYFGGVSLVARGGAGADSRRDGAALLAGAPDSTGGRSPAR